MHFVHFPHPLLTTTAFPTRLHNKQYCNDKSMSEKFRSPKPAMFRIITPYYYYTTIEILLQNKEH
ncbi:hypothetical protein GGD38_006739 [Chitinophagaceae bacterium OAS944]|nr:hypothetical protein [Chitinophagaceae bacterium OAS944]